MSLRGSEPHFHDWSNCDISSIARHLVDAQSTCPQIIAVDGRSGSGKSTFARELSGELNAALLSTDDFAWWHSQFDWTDLLVDLAIVPLRRGGDVDARPPAWVERGRPGAITARYADIVVIEGVGAGQKAMRPHVDTIVWIQSDYAEAERRGIARDLAERPDPVEAKRFWDDWMASEDPFCENQCTWEVADLIVCGTPRASDGSIEEPIPSAGSPHYGPTTPSNYLVARPGSA